MNTTQTLMLLLVSIFRVAGTCQEDGEYIYSENQIEVKRCMNDELFYYTSKYENETACLQSDTLNPGFCWWDTSVESHCLKSQECVYLYDNIPGGACYCLESTDCHECGLATPAPTFSSSEFQCPQDCKVYYLGCAGKYCNCFGQCTLPENLGCMEPVNPGCYTWITKRPTDLPTSSPTVPKKAYWGCKLCCMAKNLINATTTPIAQALNLKSHQVKVSDYTKFEGRRRLSDADSEWEILYELDLVGDESTEDLKLEDADVLTSVKESISAALNIELQDIETTSIGENQPTSAPVAASSKSDSTGAMIGGIVGGLGAVILLGFACYRIYVWKKLGTKFQPNTAVMTAEGLHPVGSDEIEYI